jgi:hypothetical protein
MVLAEAEIIVILILIILMVMAEEAAIVKRTELLVDTLQKLMEEHFGP